MQEIQVRAKIFQNNQQVCECGLTSCRNVGLEQERFQELMAE